MVYVSFVFIREVFALIEQKKNARNKESNGQRKLQDFIPINYKESNGKWKEGKLWHANYKARNNEIER